MKDEYIFTIKNLFRTTRISVILEFSWTYFVYFSRDLLIWHTSINIDAWLFLEIGDEKDRTLKNQTITVWSRIIRVVNRSADCDDRAIESHCRGGSGAEPLVGFSSMPPVLRGLNLIWWTCHIWLFEVRGPRKRGSAGDWGNLIEGWKDVPRKVDRLVKVRIESDINGSSRIGITNKSFVNLT